MELDIDGTAVTLDTDTGVFASRALDPGTALLLAEGARPTAADVATLVDLGAGYGPIAVALALRAPAATVYAVEVNERARALCATNAEAAGVAERLVVAAPGDVPAGLVVDGLWSNPPIRVGKAALHDLLSTWLDRLGPDGAAHLVVARNLGADSLARWMVERGHGVTRRASRRGYRLLDVLAARS